MKLTFLSPARRDLREAVEFYERRQEGLGARFRCAVEELCNKIVDNPTAWSLRPSGFRRANVSEFPYYLLFSINEGEVVISVVGHNRRHPDFWKHR